MNRLEGVLSQRHTVENPFALRGIITSAIQNPLLQRAIALEDTEIKLRNTPQMDDIRAQRDQIAEWKKQTQPFYNVSLATVMQEREKYTIKYDHPVCTTNDFLRGFLVNGKGPLTGLSVFQLDDGRGNRSLLDRSADKRHSYNILINILIDSVGLPTVGNGGISSRGGRLSTQLFVIANAAQTPEVILRFPDSLYTPTGKVPVLQHEVHEDRLPWSVNFQIISG